MGAVMLGGCDLVDEAKARVLGSDSVAESVEDAEPEVVAAAPEAEAAPTPEPMLLGRSGVAQVVEQAVTESRAEPASEPPTIADLGRPVEREEPSAFVPYDDGSGVVAEAPRSEPRPSIRPRPRRPRPTPRVATPVDEPCDPGLVATTPPDREWECLACGRG